MLVLPVPLVVGASVVATSLATAAFAMAPPLVVTLGELADVTLSGVSDLSPPEILVVHLCCNEVGKLLEVCCKPSVGAGDG